jgi:hypothetical protein
MTSKIISRAYTFHRVSVDKRMGRLVLLTIGLSLLALLHIIFATDFTGEISHFVQSSDWGRRVAALDRRVEPRGRMRLVGKTALKAIQPIAGIASRGFYESELPFPYNSWFFFGHRPLLTILCFGGLHAIACVFFAATAMLKRRALRDGSEREINT